MVHQVLSLFLVRNLLTCGYRHLLIVIKGLKDQCQNIIKTHLEVLVVFTDSFPVFDHFKENVAVIADSNHGWKMIGVGHLIADEILGDEQDLLKPLDLIGLVKESYIPYQIVHIRGVNK